MFTHIAYQPTLCNDTIEESGEFKEEETTPRPKKDLSDPIEATPSVQETMEKHTVNPVLCQVKVNVKNINQLPIMFSVSFSLGN
jgi:hypothetical protein